MKRSTSQSTEITYRLAQPADARQASRLIFDTFPKMATHLFGFGDKQRAKHILADIFAIEGHRFSYEFTELAYQSDNVVAMFIAYPGAGLNAKDLGLAKVIQKHYTFADKIKLITRSLPLIFIQEAVHDEYLLSNLAVKKSQRGKGIGSKVLAHVEEKAQKDGYSKLALLVDIDNHAAKRFYERHGFTVKALHLEANQRVKYLGPGHQRMVKELC